MTAGERDRVGALVLLAAVIGILYGSVKLSLGDLHRPGPGFFSFLAGLVLGILSLISLLQSLKAVPGEQSKPFWPHPGKTIKMAFVFIGLIVYVFLMDYLGFGLATFVFLAALLRGIQPQRWSIVFSVSILGVAASYAIFQYWLDLQLPKGFLGF